MNGVKRGLQLIVDFLHLLIKAIEHKNTEAIGDCVSVAQQWIHETADVSGVVKINPVALAFGSDPWVDSRKKYAKVALKWNGKL